MILERFEINYSFSPHVVFWAFFLQMRVLSLTLPREVGRPARAADVGACVDTRELEI